MYVQPVKTRTLFEGAGATSKCRSATGDASPETDSVDDMNRIFHPESTAQKTTRNEEIEISPACCFMHGNQIYAELRSRWVRCELIRISFSRIP